MGLLHAFAQYFICALLASTSASVSGQTLRQLSVAVENYGVIGARSLVRWEPNSEAGDRFVFASLLDDLWVLATVEPQLDGWRVRNVQHREANGLAPIGLLPWRRPDGDRLIVLLSGGSTWQPMLAEAVVFEGVPLRESGRFSLPPLVTAGRVADLDGDGNAELVVVTEANTFAIDPESGAVIWWYGVGGHDVELAQLDDDVALEVIIGGPEGLVIDGVSRLTEWAYTGGFGGVLAAGRLGQAGSIQFVAASDDRLSVFHGAPWSEAWDFDAYRISALAVEDLDSDGRDEILVAQGGNRPALVIDADTRTVRQSFNTSAFHIRAIAAGLAGRDAEATVAIAQDSSLMMLQLSPLSESGDRWWLRNHPGWSSALALGTLPPDPRTWLFSASSQSPNRARMSSISNGVVRWMAPAWGDVSVPFNFGAKQMLFALAGAQWSPSIVIAGSNAFESRVLVVDAASGEPVFQVGGESWDSVFSSREIERLQTVDFDGDGIEDLVVATRARFSGASGVKLHVISLLDGEVLWQSPGMGGSVERCTGLAVVPASATQPALIVAGLRTGLRAFNVETRLLEWTYEASIGAFAFQPDALAGPELALADYDGNIAHLALDTRETRRTYTLPRPVASLQSLPGGDSLVVQHGGRLRILEAGEELAVSPPVGSYSWWPLAVARQGRRYLIAAGTAFGHAVFEYDPDGVFANDFD